MGNETEEKEVVKVFRASVKIKISAKGEAFGEYGFKGDSNAELEAIGKGVEKTFREHLEKWKKKE